MFKTLLLAVDVNDPEGAEKSAKAAIEMALSSDATLHILNVVPDDGMAIVSSSFGADHANEILAKSKESLEGWVSSNIPKEVTTELHFKRGTVYDQIIKTANELDVGGIFVGAHSPALKDYLIGPNAARVARHAKQSVFVIR